MDSLGKLESILRKLGTAKLVRLYGADSVDSISGIFSEKINEIKLVELLRIKYGFQILQEKSVRVAALTALTDAERRYVLSGKNSEVRLTRDELLKLSNLRWSRNSKQASRLLEVLGLSNEYLPPEAVNVPSEITVTPSVKLFEHQLRIKDRFVRKLNDGSNKLLIHMPTGAGKTRTSVEGIIDFIKANSNRSNVVVWVAHSEELCEQALETIKYLWELRGDCDLSLCRLWGSHQVPDFNNYDGQRIVVAGFQKLYSLITSSNNEIFKKITPLKGRVELIVVDEAHKAIAPTYAQCINYLSSEGLTKLVGLTATPGRETNFQEIGGESQSETQLLAAFFDHNKIGITDPDGKDIEDPIGYLQDQGFLSRIRRKKVTTNINLELSDREKIFVSKFMDLPSSVLEKLAESEERNTLILAEIAALYQAGKKIIVFSLSVKHAHLITELLNLKGVKARNVDGGTPSSERKLILDSYKSGDTRVLVNYGVLTTGFDAPGTNAVVITRPTQSLVLYSQMIGRGIRGPRVGGEEVCDLVDLEDNLLGFPEEKQAFNHFNSVWSGQDEC